MDGRGTSRVLPRRGFTLIELVVSLSVMSIVMAAVMSTMLISLETLPDADDPGLLGADADAALESVMADAMIASSIGDGGEALKLIVPDRTGDGVEETIEYGLEDPEANPTAFVRIQNGQPARVLIDRATEFHVRIVAIEGDRGLLIAELVTGRGVVHRGSVELLTRPGG